LNSTGDKEKSLRVLVVDDEPHMLETLRFILQDRYRVQTASDGASAIAHAQESRPHAVLLDIIMPGMSGLDALPRIKEASPDTEVVMVTAVNDVRKAVEAMKAGAFDYITKPFEEEDLVVALEKALEKALLNREVVSLRREVAEAYGHGEMVGETPCMKELGRTLDRVADQDVSVLVTGESGTGKELIARALHYRGARRRGPFVAVNCARFGIELAESELFGHVKGAFTGATSAHRGSFEQADGGTLFLDEIGAMPFDAQSKLLRVLEEKRITPLGAERSREVDVRLVAATNVDLARAVRRNRFREDLYYRLKVIQIQAPTLRARQEDIPLLVDHFLARHGRSVGSPVRSVSPKAMEILKCQFWRGNVRELGNVILTLMCTAEKETIEAEDLGAPVLDVDGGEPAGRGVTREELVSSLEAAQWNLTASGRILGVHRNTVRNLMDRFEVRKPPPRRGGTAPG